MSSIDLERLIVRQTYFIPVKSSKLIEAILNELQASEPKINGLDPWGIVEAHKLSVHFQYDVKYAYLSSITWGMKSGTEKFRKLMEEGSEEFEEHGLETFLKVLEGFQPKLPMAIYVSVKNIEKSGCLCKVECVPALYEQLSYFEDLEPSNFEMQNAYLTCKRFLETIFECGLFATLVSEEKKELWKSTAQLLINDHASRQILSMIEEMLEQATGEVLVCGWIGTLLLPKLKEIKQKGVNIRVITHKKTELKGQPGRQDIQRAFGELISMISEDNISIRPECHCRVVVVDNKALIGSMDLNATSLTGSHRELAIYTEDTEIVRNLRKYFNGIFSPLSKEEAK